MSTGPRRWTEALRSGLIWGAVAVFLALAGMVEALAGRQVVAGLPSLGVLLPPLSALAAGCHAARRAAGTAAALVHGVVAGTTTGTLVAALVLTGSLLDLRRVFVNASPALFRLLLFDRDLEGAWTPVAAAAVAGVAGAVGTLLPPRFTRAVVTGLAWVLALGLFQELVQLLLVDGTVRTAIRDVLYTTEALSPGGSALVFIVAAAGTWAWATHRSRLHQWAAELPPRPARLLRGLGFVAIAAAMLALPLVAGPFLSHVLVLVGLYVLMGLGLNLEVGFAGLLDLGFVAFFAIGAYTVGLLTSAGGLAVTHLSFWAAVPVAVAVSLIAGVVLGLPVLRIRGDYLAIATLGFGEIIRILVLSDFLRPWLGGSQGVLSIPKPEIFGLELAGPQHLFYLTLAASALVALVAARLRDSRLGRAWMALREDEDVAEAMGINLVNIKLLAYGLGAAFAGVSGALFAVLVGSVFPHSFQLLISINVLALIIVGGMGSMPGVVVGALFLVGLPELLREFSDFRFLIYGAALVIMMQLRPEGLWPAAAVRRELHAGEEMKNVRGPAG
ncbi:MAG: branched-chain amino acid ABC transporter permease [Candidatus Rokubacteria bacterium]|nr:branched-chain amino acid ABC transporter permease [Candidatus Rokubacteria bacterium]